MDTKTVLLLMCVLSRVRFDPNVAAAFQQFELVPDVLDIAPKQELTVEYNGRRLHLGLEFTPTEVKNQPIVSWDACATAFYTFIMLDPDAPSRTDHSISEWFHWLVVNIPGTDISRGQILMAYIGSGPALNSGLHRYTFLVYKQNGQQTFSEQYVNDTMKNYTLSAQAPKPVLYICKKNLIYNMVFTHYFLSNYRLWFFKILIDVWTITSVNKKNIMVNSI